MQKKKDLTIGENTIKPGERKRFKLDVASLYDYTELNIPIEVVRGWDQGPTLFVSAAIHGDEINGVEIIKRLLHQNCLKNLKGTLVAVPVVNIFGFNNKSRYLPDRRDLNRSFPGSLKGSLASQLANIFIREVVSKCTHGIDLHTGALHRSNLPQIRAFLDDNTTRKMALAFGAPVMINSKLRDGSLREAARKRKINMLLYEGGEALRFEENVITAGLNGCLSVMASIGMISKTDQKFPKVEPKSIFKAAHSHWVRADHSGSFRVEKQIGDTVKKGEVLATISDLFGRNQFKIKASSDGLIVGLSKIPLVNRGDAVFHIATRSKPKHLSKILGPAQDSIDLA